MTGVVTLGTTRYTLVKNGGKVQVLTGGATGPTGATGATGAAGADADIAADTHAATSKATPVDADEMPLADSAAAWGLKKLTWANLKAATWAAWGALIAAGTVKATPVDADAIALMDSAASNATKKLTWANLLATVLAYIAPRAFQVGSLQLGGTTGSFPGLRPNGPILDVTTADQGAWALLRAASLQVMTGGLAFPATQNPIADPNTLDDYEEGTFTPTVAFSGAAVGVTYSVQIGRYTKVGNKVSIKIRLVLTNKGSSVGTITVDGLPFATNASGDASSFTVWAQNLASISGSLQGAALQGGTQIFISHLGTGSAAALSNSNAANNTELTISGTYFV